ncbi:XRE family transcriptional regulator [Acinetobacter sp. YH12086]|uniref:XRE family transcriptional regulator n=1 Tax=Acinetobacter sp. YH12086 TaxID=2601078 RepID=UPI00211ECE76|nr:XRE family transcriptional regulator [Acinetobacter sp. YH12086]
MLFNDMDKPLTQAERLKASRLKAGYTQKQVAEGVGMKQPSYSHLEKVDFVNSTKLPEIAQFLGVDVYWLKSGVGTSDVDANIRQMLEKSPNIVIDSPEIEDDKIWIDLVNIRFSCGEGESIEFHYDDVIGKRGIPAQIFKKHNVKPENARMAIAHGDSQEPYVCSGDEFAIDTSDTTARDGEFYAVYFQGEAMLKQIFKEDGGKLVLHSLNSKYKDKVVNDSNGAGFRIIGRQFYRAG